MITSTELSFDDMFLVTIKIYIANRKSDNVTVFNRIFECLRRSSPLRSKSKHQHISALFINFMLHFMAMLFKIYTHLVDPVNGTWRHVIGIQNFRGTKWCQPQGQTRDVCCLCARKNSVTWLVIVYDHSLYRIVSHDCHNSHATNHNSRT